MIKSTEATLVTGVTTAKPTDRTRTSSTVQPSASRVLKTTPAPAAAQSVSGVQKVVRPVTAISGTPVSYPVQVPEKVLPAIIASAPQGTMTSITRAASQQTSRSGSTVASPVQTIIAENRAVNIDPPDADKKFGDTVVGKILKGAAIAGGSVLGLGAVIGGVTGAASGTGVLSGAVGGVAKIVKTVGGGLDKVGTAAVNLLTGTTEEERRQVKEVKAEAKAAQEQLEQVDRLVKAGASPEAARNMAGIPDAQLTEYKGEQLKMAGFDSKTLLIIGGIAAALFILPKLFKTRR